MGILKRLKAVKQKEAKKEKADAGVSSSRQERAEKTLQDQPIDLSTLSLKEIEQLMQKNGLLQEYPRIK